jgi:hypothetical protein
MGKGSKFSGGVVKDGRISHDNSFDGIKVGWITKCIVLYGKNIIDPSLGFTRVGLGAGARIDLSEALG